jgi:hypothetical protein
MQGKKEGGACFVDVGKKSKCFLVLCTPNIFFSVNYYDCFSLIRVVVWYTSKHR